MIAFNKWDLVDEERRYYLDREIERELVQVQWAPRINVTARTGWHIDRLVPALDAALEGWETRITTGPLNSFLGRLVAEHPHPVRGGKQPKILFGTQATTAPPTFVLFTSGKLDAGYERFIERRLREEFGFVGTPDRAPGAPAGEAQALSRHPVVITAAPMMPARLRSVAGTISVSISSSGRNSSASLLIPATHDEQVGGEQHLERPVVRRQPLGPLLPREVLALPDAVGGALLRVVAVDLEVAELGVRDQDAVVDQRGADAGAEGGQDDQPARGPCAAPYRDLGEAGRIGVVDHVHVAAEPPR